MSDYGKRTALLLLLAAGTLRVSVAGGPFSTEGGPLEVDSRLRPTIEHGLHASATLAGLVDAIESARMTRLRVTQRRTTGSGIRAQSRLSVQHGVTWRSRDRDYRIDAITGVVLLPPDVAVEVKLALLAHELAHVVIRLDGGVDPGERRDEEQLARAVELVVVAELRANGRRSRTVTAPSLPARLASRSAAANLRHALGLDEPS